MDGLVFKLLPASRFYFLRTNRSEKTLSPQKHHQRCISEEGPSITFPGLLFKIKHILVLGDQTSPS